MPLASMVPCSLSDQLFKRKSMKIVSGYESGEPVGKCHLGMDMRLRLLASPLMAAAIAVSPISYPQVSVIDVEKGGAVFQRACIGCHDGGGNIIQPGATLFLKDLQRNGVDTEEDIYRVTYYGKGRMPGFGENCTPRGQCTFGPRLTEDEIKLLAEFVKLQADHGWSNVQSGD